MRNQFLLIIIYDRRSFVLKKHEVRLNKALNTYYFDEKSMFNDIKM